MTPPPLEDWLRELRAARQSGKDGPFLLNLDASRLISEGNAALGGGHNDIFKDDVVNLIWAVTQLPPKPQNADTDAAGNSAPAALFRLSAGPNVPATNSPALSGHRPLRLLMALRVQLAFARREAPSAEKDDSP